MSRSGLVAVGGENGKVWLWDPSVAGSERAVVDAGASITDVALSPDGSLLAVVVRDGALTVVDAADGDGGVVPSRVAYRGVAFGGDSVLVVGHGDKVDVLDPRSGESLGGFDSTFDRVLDVTASEDGTVVAAGGVGGQVLIHDRRRGRPCRSTPPHTGEVLGVDLRPDGKVLATASTDGTAKVWDAASGRLLGTHLGHEGACRPLRSHRPDPPSPLRAATAPCACGVRSAGAGRGHAGHGREGARGRVQP